MPQVQASLEAVYASIEQQIRALDQSLQTLLEPYRRLVKIQGIGWVTAAVLIG